VFTGVDKCGRFNFILNLFIHIHTNKNGPVKSLNGLNRHERI